MSGCSVWWAYRPDDVKQGWRPSFSRWIGVQSGYFQRVGALKVVPWQVVEKIATKRWPELEPVLKLRGAGSLRQG
jgi:hypothetical protein